MKELQKKLQAQMDKTIEALKFEFSTIRAGRANAQMLDKIRVDYYGTPTPINQIGSISVPEPRTLVINPWDKSAMKEIEKAIKFAYQDPNLYAQSVPRKNKIPTVDEVIAFSLTKIK